MSVMLYDFASGGLQNSVYIYEFLEKTGIFLVIASVFVVVANHANAERPKARSTMLFPVALIVMAWIAKELRFVVAIGSIFVAASTLRRASWEYRKLMILLMLLIIVFALLKQPIANTFDSALIIA